MLLELLPLYSCSTRARSWSTCSKWSTRSIAAILSGFRWYNEFILRSSAGRPLPYDIPSSLHRHNQWVRPSPRPGSEAPLAQSLPNTRFVRYLVQAIPHQPFDCIRMATRDQEDREPHMDRRRQAVLVWVDDRIHSQLREGRQIVHSKYRALLLTNHKHPLQHGLTIRRHLDITLWMNIILWVSIYR